MITHREATKTQRASLFFRTAATFLTALLFLFSCSDGSVHAKKVDAEFSILFIGNSFTSHNNLPQMFQELAKDAGIGTHVESVVKGGARLQDHAQGTEAIGKIRSRAWNFLILQEQSQYPAYSKSRQEMKNAVRILKDASKGTPAKTLLFLTWGYRNGDRLKSQDLEMHSFEGMQKRLKQGYEEVGNELSLDLCPVGLAWEKAKKMDQRLDLWSADGVHPSFQGTYLSASCFYAALFQRSPVGLKFTAGLDTEQAKILQLAAEQTCLTALK